MKKIFALIIIIYLLFPNYVYAQENQFSLSVNPTTVQVNAENGSQPRINITLSNKGKDQVTLIPSYSFFKDSFKHNGEVTYIPDGELDNSEKDLLSKIKLFEADISTDKITLLPLETKQVSLVIDLSAAHGSGDYYFSVIFTKNATDQSKAESTTQITPGVATNILLTIGQKEAANGSVLEFSSPFFISSGPAPFTLLVQNDSKNTIIPSGQINISNMFGRKVDSIEIRPAIVLSDSKRYITQVNKLPDQKTLVELQKKYNLNQPIITFADSFMFGLYTADLRIKMSPEGQIFERSIKFIVLPLPLIIILTVIFFVAISIYIKARRKAN